MKIHQVLHILKSNWLLVTLLALLAVITAYNAFYASVDLLNNSDNIIYPYLFGDAPLANQMILPGKHPNIFKFPLFIIQTLLPYGPKAIIVVNILTSLITYLGCVLILFLIFKRKYWIPIVVAGIVLSLLSTALHNLTIYTTVRNLEFIVALLFIVVIGKILITKQEIGRRLLWASLIIAILMAVVISGDDYFSYILLAPLAAILVLHLIFRKYAIRKFMLLSALLAGTFLLAKVIAFVLLQAGVYINNPDYLSEVSLTKVELILPSLVTAALQFLEVTGFVFDGPLLSVIARNSLLSILALAGFTGYALAFINYFKKDTTLPTTVTFISFASFTATFLAYVFSGLVLQPAAYGDNSVLMNQRYIAIMPFLLLIGIGYFLIAAASLKIVRKYKLFIVCTLVLLALFSIPSVLHSNTVKYEASSMLRHSFKDTASTLSEKDIDVVLSGYWYGSAVRLWSGNTINFAVVAECNKPSITNARIDWYTPDPSTKKSALIIDTSGPDIPYLGYCTEKELHDIYGKPAYILQSDSSVDKNKPVNIWVYDYDVREKIQQIDL